MSCDISVVFSLAALFGGPRQVYGLIDMAKSKRSQPAQEK
jgi:hypothetical protein